MRYELLPKSAAKNAYKKPAWRLAVLVLLVCLLAAGCSLTGPGRQERSLTLEEVTALAEKGQELDWADFEGYTFIETGSGLYIRIYELDERFSLWIGGPGPAEAPWYIRLVSAKDLDDYVDIRTGDVEAFIRERQGEE